MEFRTRRKRVKIHFIPGGAGGTLMGFIRENTSFHEEIFLAIQVQRLYVHGRSSEHLEVQVLRPHGNAGFRPMVQLVAGPWAFQFWWLN